MSQKLDLRGNKILADSFDGAVVNSDVAALDDLSGTLTGTADGTMEDVADIALSTTDTYTDAAVNSAVNAAVAETNLQLKELQEAYNALLNALKE